MGGLIVNAVLIAVGSLASALSINAASLIASRFVTGLGIGGAEIAIINTYVSEVTPPAGIRGKMVQLTYLAGALGFALTPPS